jgi:hypothetical protein
LRRQPLHQATDLLGRLGVRLQRSSERWPSRADDLNTFFEFIELFFRAFLGVHVESTVEGVSSQHPTPGILRCSPGLLGHAGEGEAAVRTTFE